MRTKALVAFLGTVGMALLGSCRQSNTLVLHLSGLPAEARTLKVRWQVEEQPERELRPALPLDALGGRSEGTFGLRLPDEFQGRLVVAVAAFQDACLLATSAAEWVGGGTAELALPKIGRAHV